MASKYAALKYIILYFGPANFLHLSMFLHTYIIFIATVEIYSILAVRLQVAVNNLTFLLNYIVPF